MKLRDLTQFFRENLFFDDALKELNDPSFTYHAASDDKKAAGYTNNVRNAALSNTYAICTEVTPNLLSSAIHETNRMAPSPNFIHYSQKDFAREMKVYIRSVQKALQSMKITPDSDANMVLNSDTFIKYMIICEFEDEILEECGNDEELKNAIDALSNNPKMKLIEARMNIIANPFYAKYYNNGAIYTAPNISFADSENIPDGNYYLHELQRNLNVVREVMSLLPESEINQPVSSQIAARAEPLARSKKMLNDLLSAEGYTKEQTEQLSFFDANGKKIDDIAALSRKLTANRAQPYFFAALPGGPLIKYDNSITPKLLPSDKIIYTRTAGNPYENLFRSGMDNLPASARTAHIYGGSPQYAEMERLFNEYCALISKKGFNQLRAAELIKKLNVAADAYLDFKEAQRGNPHNGVILGKNSREQRRIDFAYSVKYFTEDKLEYTDNIRTGILLNTQYITLENPTDELQKNRLASNITSADTINKRNQLVGDFFSNTVYNQLESVFKAAADNNIDPLNYIIIDGMSASARVRIHLNSLITPEDISDNAGPPVEKKTYQKDGLRIASEIIACALLARRPVTIHAANGSIRHLDNPLTIKADPKGFTIKDSTPAPDYFINKFKEQGFDRTMYFDGEMTAGKTEDALRSINMFKENEARSAFNLINAKKDYIIDWMSAHQKDQKYLEKKHVFSLSRTASVSVPRGIAIGRGMSIEDVMTNGVKHDEKKAIGSSFMDKCDDLYEKRKALPQNNPEALAKFEQYESNSLNEIAEDIYKGYVQLIDYVDTSITKIELGNLESMFNSKNAMLLESHQTLFDLCQEVKNIESLFSNIAFANDKGSKSSKETYDKLTGTMAMPINDYMAAAKFAFIGSSQMLSGQVSPGDASNWLRSIMTFTVFSKTLNERLKANPNARFHQLFNSLDELSILRSKCDMTFLDAYQKLKPPAEMNRLLAKLALDGKLGDYIISKTDGTLSFDVNKFAEYASNTFEAENKVIAANKNAMKKHNAAEKENPNHIERANIAAEPQKGGINL